MFGEVKLMAGKQVGTVRLTDKAEDQSCIHECVWYEPCEQDGSCQNRRNFICSKHREEVFGNEE